ncbi:hypothetical protein CPB86DRAFT_784881 [Serendipita vermifera]|nr:hypothetical protein CPB86DRAFT_784881 [Serendipita vermifera]
MRSFVFVTFLFTLFFFARASPSKRQFNACVSKCITRGPPLNLDFSDCPNDNDITCLCQSNKYMQGVINCVSSLCDSSEQSASYAELELRCLQAGVSSLSGVTTPGVTSTATRTVIDASTTVPTASGTSTFVGSTTVSQTSSSLRILPTLNWTTGFPVLALLSYIHM